MKLKRGDILGCEPEAGCGLKVIVIEACEEVDCDLKCCGKDMTLVKKEGEEIWKKYVKEADPEIWKKYAKGEKKE